MNGATIADNQCRASKLSRQFEESLPPKASSISGNSRKRSLHISYRQGVKVFACENVRLRRLVESRSMHRNRYGNQPKVPKERLLVKGKRRFETLIANLFRLRNVMKRAKEKSACG